MNYNLDTPDGMANAVVWLNNCLEHLVEGGTWIVPRSASLVKVVSHDRKLCEVFIGLPDPAIKRVIKEAGWTIVQHGEKS